MNRLPEYWKGLIAAVAAVATVLLGVLPPNSPGWIIATCVVAAAGAVGVIVKSNRKRPEAPGDYRI